MRFQFHQFINLDFNSSIYSIFQLLYLCFGTQQLVLRDCEGLQNKIDLYLDEELIELPELQSIVLLNIDSWGAGCKLCCKSLDFRFAILRNSITNLHHHHHHHYFLFHFPFIYLIALSNREEESDDSIENSISDGKMEVFGIVSSFHIAQLQVGLGKPIRLGQAKQIRVGGDNILIESLWINHPSIILNQQLSSIFQMILKATCPIQVDGEPWIQPAAELRLQCRSKVRMLTQCHLHPTDYLL